MAFHHPNPAFIAVGAPCCPNDSTETEVEIPSARSGLLLLNHQFSRMLHRLDRLQRLDKRDWAQCICVQCSTSFCICFCICVGQVAEQLWCSGEAAQDVSVRFPAETFWEMLFGLFPEFKLPKLAGD
jgi:hypothetical protein